MSDETILVVDDNRQNADLLAHTLLPSLGYKSLVAHDGRAALEMLSTRQVSLILLDLKLKDTDGLEILRQVTDNGYYVPTILAMAHNSEQIASDAFLLGVKDFLVKPVDADSLEAAITRALKTTRLDQEKNHLATQLKEQVTWLKVLSKIGQSLTASLDLDLVLRRIVDASVKLSRAEEGFLALLDEGSGQLYLRAVKNLDREIIQTMRLPLSDSTLGAVIRTGLPLRMSRNGQELPIKISTGLLVQSLIYIPIVSKGKVLGVLSAVNRLKKQEFKEIDEALLASLADYAAIAIENASLYTHAQDKLKERKRAEAALRESEARYSLAVQGANDGLWDWDLRTNEVYYSPRWKSILGYNDVEIGTSPEEWFRRVHPNDLQTVKMDLSAHIRGLISHFENEHRIRHADDQYRWVLSRGLAVWEPDRNATRMAGSLTDITDRKETEQKFIHDSLHDALTGLPNRALFIDRLTHAIARAKRRKDYHFAVLFLDLDRFKDVNDSLGHMVGDKLLVTIGQRLVNGLRTTDTVARLGGDEFVILLEDINDARNATRVADWVLEELTASFSLVGHELFISTSIGIVLSTSGYEQPDDVLRDADIALYNAKAKGKGRYEIFDPPMRARIMERLKMETDLRRALEQEELRVHYQPIVSLEDGHLVGFEALVRWQHPERGLLSPGEFLPLAEECGAIIPIDHWVLREACCQMRRWQERLAFVPQLTISVNLSGRHFAQSDLIETVSTVLDETGLEPCCLKLEITENAILDENAAIAEVLEKLQNLGVEIQIDDFGIGYSSLGYLSNFPVDALKIDRSFIGKITEDSNHYKIVQAIVLLTRRLNVGLIAEGVETVGQLARLKAMGCSFGQGFLVSKPLDELAVEGLLSEGLTSESLYTPWRQYWQ